jgi:hypothetical protein
MYNEFSSSAVSSTRSNKRVHAFAVTLRVVQLLRSASGKLEATCQRSEQQAGRLTTDTVQSAQHLAILITSRQQSTHQSNAPEFSTANSSCLRSRSTESYSGSTSWLKHVWALGKLFRAEGEDSSVRVNGGSNPSNGTLSVPEQPHDHQGTPHSHQTCSMGIPLLPSQTIIAAITNTVINTISRAEQSSKPSSTWTKRTHRGARFSGQLKTASPQSV